MAVDEDSPYGQIEALIDFSSKGYDTFHWIRWPSLLDPDRAYLIGWPMDTRPIPQGNQSNGETMWAYSDRVH